MASTGPEARFAVGEEPSHRSATASDPERGAAGTKQAFDQTLQLGKTITVWGLSLSAFCSDAGGDVIEDIQTLGACLDPNAVGKY